MTRSKNRYASQMILPEFGLDGQERLQAAHVLVVGAGGLGSPALQYLAGAGIGKITLVDADIITKSNLHRQTLYREDQIGQSKAETASAVLIDLNRECKICPRIERLDADNVASLLAEVDVALDCADNFATSYILSDSCLKHCVPLISASALGWSGYVGGFCGSAPSLRAVFPELPNHAASCDSAGVLGPVVGAIGCLQAQMMLSYLLNLSPSPLGQIITLDCRTFRFSGFRFDLAIEPEEPVLKFISPASITPDDYVIELRSDEEAPLPVVPTAIRYCVTDFKFDGPKPTSEPRAVFCCRNGFRAWQAAQRLQSYWEGEISLIAVGDKPHFTTRN